jgi:hypothetical protein
MQFRNLTVSLARDDFSLLGVGLNGLLLCLSKFPRPQQIYFSTKTPVQWEIALLLDANDGLSTPPSPNPSGILSNDLASDRTESVGITDKFASIEVP